jgi:hypothetical protein
MTPIPSNSNSPDDAEQMRLAFEAFMLQGKGAAIFTAASGDASTNTSITTSANSKKKKKKKRPPAGPSPQKQTTTPSKTEMITSPSPSKLDQSTKKRYYQLLRSFSNKIQQSWFEVDDQMLAVLESIVSIRGRLHIEWKMLNSYDTRLTYKGQEMGGQNWKDAGCRGKHEMQQPLHLHQADVQLALENDLDQHEKMIGALRSLISELSETHDSLGRLVDTIWMFHLDSRESILEVGDENDEQNGMDLLVQNTNDLFQILSLELYRKQSLVPAVIASINDEMLCVKSDPISSESTPLEVARSCQKDWKRQVDGELLTWLSKLSSQ